MGGNHRSSYQRLADINQGTTDPLLHVPLVELLQHTTITHTQGYSTAVTTASSIFLFLFAPVEDFQWWQRPHHLQRW
jgi:hypothetical protein